ncbi:hypothetical protein [Bifidobacterium panos]|uniref:FtsK/SpoIIIE family protein n=1 Tax=Bifidobacterium panos TaxID=2675321 RepID=A0ABX1SVV6_9BIFI|nr:hypothetical protein [Bifidobacterium sp. DSM 109963]NMN01480.1 FtsK/SpoIIIE family protein [Bifidobacterium sp. DSM 109963]
MKKIDGKSRAGLSLACSLLRAVCASLAWLIVGVVFSLVPGLPLWVRLSPVACLLALTGVCLCRRLPERVRRDAGYCIPVLGDLMRRDRRRRRRDANGWLRECAVVRRDDETVYEVYLRRPSLKSTGLLEVDDLPVYGMSEERLRRALRDGMAACDAEDFDLYRPDPVRWPHRWRATLYYNDRLAGLREPRRLDALPDTQVGTGHLSVLVGRALHGERRLELSELPGLTFAGIPGMGKTAAASLLVSGLLSRPDLVDVYVADGKGGGDWQWAGRFLPEDRYTNDDSYEHVLAMLRHIQLIMRERLSSNAASHGDSNFWHWGPTREQKAVVLVLDEIQTWTDPASRTKANRDKAAEFTALATDLVKKGRSAGISVLAMTQKPTTDSLPSALRDNAAMKTAFRCTTPDMAKAALGTIPDDAPDPTLIPGNAKGLSVMTRPDGGAEWVQWDWLPEPLIPRLLETARDDTPPPPRR